MEYTWSLPEDSGGGGNTDSTDRTSIAGGQRLVIDARRLPHPTPGLTFIIAPNLFLVYIIFYVCNIYYCLQERVYEFISYGNDWK